MTSYRMIRVDLSSPGETAIRKAIQAVEEMGADVRLTEVVMLLGQAQAVLGSYVDEQLWLALMAPKE